MVPENNFHLFCPSLLKALPALSLPIIILGGIAFGIVTPTEAAGVAAVAALGAGLFYGGISFRNLLISFERTAIMTGSIFTILAAAACFFWVASLEQWPPRIATLVVKLGFTGVPFLLMLNGFFLLTGMFMDIPIVLALLVPLFGPAISAQGFNPIHVGIVICLNLTIGSITPPYGGSLVVVSAITRENYLSLCKAVIPFCLIEITVLLFITLVPELSLFLPRLLGFG